MQINISVGEEKFEVEKLIRKKATKFSNVGHIIVPVNFVGKNTIIILPKIKMTKVLTASVKKRKNGNWAIGKARE